MGGGNRLFGPCISLNRLFATLTILAIVGTLCACGRYGPPVRPTSSDVLRASPNALTAPAETPTLRGSAAERERAER